MNNPPKKPQLSRLVVRGFKSIADCDIQLESLNVLVGANGAGKSNFIEFFEMIEQLPLDFFGKRGPGSVGNLDRFVRIRGGADSILHFGRKVTKELLAELYFGQFTYKSAFVPTQNNSLVEKYIEKGMPTQEVEKGMDYIHSAMRGCRVYHFHDSGKDARLKQLNNIHDNKYLQADAGNLGAFLLKLKKKYQTIYTQIVETIKLVAPFFVDFYLEADDINSDRITLKWIHEGYDNPVFNAHLLSDGTLRFACLATLFLQPPELQPEIILIDEPELGLHPLAINLLAGLISSASTDKQIIVSTQSVELVNQFEPDDLIVVDRNENQSMFRRLSIEDLGEWLDDYALGELWEKNVFGGGPLK